MDMNSDKSEPKTLIGVLASHDDDERNNALVALFDNLKSQNPDLLEQFRFVFTGGTFDRIIHGTQKPRIPGIQDDTKNFLFNRCGVIRLPSRLEGGVTVLTYLIVQRAVSIIWPFLTPLTSHWLNPENLALMRLCDQWHVKRLMNSGSVEEWFAKEADKDVKRNLQEWPPSLMLSGSGQNLRFDKTQEGFYKITMPPPIAFPKSFTDMTIALIAHDQMKNRMMDFATDYERELAQFNCILSTGTTGLLVEKAVPSLKHLIKRYHSGPKGGDIEIATEILFGGCHVVIFFIDPLHPHPHIEDIRVVFGACIIQDQVRMLSNEMQAREWIDRVVRG